MSVASLNGRAPIQVAASARAFTSLAAIELMVFTFTLGGSGQRLILPPSHIESVGVYLTV